VSPCILYIALLLGLNIIIQFNIPLFITWYQSSRFLIQPPPFHSLRCPQKDPSLLLGPAIVDLQFSFSLSSCPSSCSYCLAIAATHPLSNPDPIKLWRCTLNLSSSIIAISAARSTLRGGRLPSCGSRHCGSLPLHGALIHGHPVHTTHRGRPSNAGSSASV
jgi:hypothetical protein